MIAVFRYTLGQDRLQVVPRFPPQNHLLLQPYQNAALSFSRCTCNCGCRQRAYVTEVDNSDLKETTRTVKELAPALSPECIVTLLEIIKGRISDDCRSEWHEMGQALKKTLVKEVDVETT